MTSIIVNKKMIVIKLKDICLKLGKNISDISRETGINRNTITSLYHNKVDGIKFETLEKICDKYDLELSDILENKKDHHQSEKTIYRQAGSFTPFGLSTIILSLGNYDKESMPLDFKDVKMYFEKGGRGGVFYADADRMNEIATTLIETCKDAFGYGKMFGKYLAHAELVEQIYGSSRIGLKRGMKEAGLRDFFLDFKQKYKEFWRQSMFISSMDAGFDQGEIARISKIYGFNTEEVAILTASEKLLFSQERLLAVLNLVKSFVVKKLPVAALGNFLKKSAEAEKYFGDYDFYLLLDGKNDSGKIDDLRAEVSRYLRDKKLLSEELKKLENYEKEIFKKKKRILDKYKIASNPLEVFAKLSYWREHRKRVSLMGEYLLSLVVMNLEKLKGIPFRYLNCAVFEEFDGIIKGLVGADVLRERFEAGCMIIVDGDDYRMIQGSEATSLAEELDNRLSGEVESRLISGTFVARGYAKGLARKIVIGKKNSKDLDESDIIVIDKFDVMLLPYLKKASAIIIVDDDRDGLAAVFAREHGKPCLVGAKNVMDQVKENDLLELRANHGTARILNKN